MRRIPATTSRLPTRRRRLIKKLSNTTGPVSRRTLDQGAHPTSMIALMFDSNIGDQKEAFLVADLQAVRQGWRPDVRIVQRRSGARMTNSGIKFSAWGKDAAVTVHDSTGGVSVYATEQPTGRPDGGVPRSPGPISRTGATSARPMRATPTCCSPTAASARSRTRTRTAI